jgi:hypothetical protein
MLGSAQKADAFLRQLAEVCRQDPVRTARPAAVSVATGRYRHQRDDVIPIMRTLGDITAGMGTGSEGIQRAVVAFQQMNAAGGSPLRT